MDDGVTRYERRTTKVLQISSWGFPEVDGGGQVLGVTEAYLLYSYCSGGADKVDNAVSKYHTNQQTVPDVPAIRVKMQKASESDQFCMKKIKKCAVLHPAGPATLRFETFHGGLVIDRPFATVPRFSLRTRTTS